MVNEDQLINFLDNGTYFGEIALLTNLKRTATVRAYKFCTLSVMDKNTI